MQELLNALEAHANRERVLTETEAERIYAILYAHAAQTERYNEQD